MLLAYPGGENHLLSEWSLPNYLAPYRCCLGFQIASLLAHEAACGPSASLPVSLHPARSLLPAPSPLFASANISAKAFLATAISMPVIQWSEVRDMVMDA